MNDDNKIKSIIKSKGFFAVVITGVCAVLVLCYTTNGVRKIGNISKDNVSKINNIELSQNDDISQNNDTKEKKKKYENNITDSINKSSDNTTYEKSGLQENTQKNKKIDSQEENSKTKQNEATKIPEETKKTAFDDEKDITDNMVEVISVADNNLVFNEEEGLLWPVNGDIIMKYSMDKLIYFQTLGQFKCNPAIFISAKEGTKVVNSYESVVSKVYNDSELGNVVEVLMGNNYKITYGQLKNVKVKEGEVLKEGVTIGAVAKQTAYYEKEGTHLYFSVEQDTQSVDPMLLLR